MTDATLSLSLISEHRILDKAAGLNEPSGLTLNHDGSALYTVSDDTKAVFRLDLKGRLSITESFFIGVDDLEGIAINGDGSRLHAVQEETNALITIDIATRRELSRRPLAAMANYESVERYLSGSARQQRPGRNHREHPYRTFVCGERKGARGY